MATGFHWDRTRTLVMGVLNVTPDSFSDGGQFVAADRALEHARAMLRAGADIIDIGGESTRPGAAAVSAEEEWRRVGPVLRKLSVISEQLSGSREQSAVRISIDTTKAEVAEWALAAGARIVNDISALRSDARMVEVVRKAGAGLILMHRQGTPATMQQDPRYQDVVGEVRDFLAERIEFAVAGGLPRESLAIDPGIGFGKMVEHNLRLLARLHEFRTLGCAVAIGTSRKAFIGKVLGREPGQRLAGTAATVAWAVAQGAGIVRVHDVAEMVDVVKMTEAIQRGGVME